MARVKFNSLVTAIEGSIGNLTIQRNAVGYSVRQKPFSNVYPSDSQLNNRSWLLQCQTAWHSLPAEAIQKWNDFPAFIKTFTRHSPDVLLSGYQLFLKHNLRLLAAGKAIMTNIQYCSNEFQDTQFDVWQTPSEFELSLLSSFNESLYTVLVKCSSPLRYQTNCPDQFYRVVIPVISYSSELVMFPQYSSIFGRGPLTGEYVYISIQFLHLLMPYAQAPFMQWFKQN